MKDKNIVYVNFAQYDNTGRILDFLTENFSIVAHFSYDHLRLKNGRPTSYFRVYKKRKLILEEKLIGFRVPAPLLFPSLPLVALSMFLQTIWYSWKLSRKYKFEYFITLNAYSAWIGNLMRKLGIVHTTIFWVGDYFPVDYPDIRMKFARWVYWKFDRPAMQQADKLIFTNKRLLALYKKMDLLPKTNNFAVVPIGTTLAKVNIQRKKNIIGFLGMLKSSQGLELLFTAMPALLKKYPDLVVEIVGSGPEEDVFVQLAKPFKRKIKFYGFVESQDKIQQIAQRWMVGIATYQPKSSNESYWGDPSKIKVYLSVGVPVITTDVSYMADIIKQAKAGKMISYNPNSLVTAATAIFSDNKNYQKNAYILARKYSYKDAYPTIFQSK